MAQKESSPLDQLLEHDFQEVLCPESERGCLLLVPAQTGIGKTHTIKNAILREILQIVRGQSESRPIYYITNSVDNVSSTYQELMELIDAEYSDSSDALVSCQSLKDQIVYLPNQSSQLLSVSEQDIDYLIERFDLSGHSGLIQEWQQLKAQQQVIREHPAIRAEFSRDIEAKAGQVYSQLISALQARQKSPAAITLKAKDENILDALIPDDRLYRGGLVLVL